MIGRRLGIGALVACVLLAGGAQTVSANLVWCDDPPILVVTPGGTTLMVNNSLALSRADMSSRSLITHDATTEPNRAGGTLITIHFYVPGAIHDGATVVSTNHRFNVSDMRGTPTGSTVVTLHLAVPIS
jgi:hypothetical protein